MSTTSGPSRKSVTDGNSRVIVRRKRPGNGFICTSSLFSRARRSPSLCGAKLATRHFPLTCCSSPKVMAAHRRRPGILPIRLGASGMPERSSRCRTLLSLKSDNGWRELDSSHTLQCASSLTKPVRDARYNSTTRILMGASGLGALRTSPFLWTRTTLRRSRAPLLISRVASFGSFFRLPNKPRHAREHAARRQTSGGIHGECRVMPVVPVCLLAREPPGSPSPTALNTTALPKIKSRAATRRPRSVSTQRKMCGIYKVVGSTQADGPSLFRRPRPTDRRRHRHILQ